MTNEEKIEVFKDELALITDACLQEFVKIILSGTGDWFYHDPASTSGKHHPQYALGDGGLVRHTKAVVYFLNELMKTKMFTISPHEYELLVAAAILHDIRKHTADGGYVENHAREACVLVMRTQKSNQDLLSIDDAAQIAAAIGTHMGIWGIPQGERKPIFDNERILHLADYCASRKEVELTIFQHGKENLQTEA